MKIPINVDFHVAASAYIGRGHFSRCLQLADAFKKAGAHCTFKVTEPAFVASDCAYPVTELTDEDWQVTRNEHGPRKIVVIDGYDFPAEHISRLTENGIVTLVLDDLGERPVRCTLLLNHNAYGDTINYDLYDAFDIAAGPAFALVKPSFHDVLLTAGSAGSLSIALGGGQTALEGIKLADALVSHPDVSEINVALGTNPTPGWTERQVGHCLIRLHTRADLVELFRRSETIITSLGVTFLEALATGRSIVAIALADNQALNLAYCHQNKIPAADGIEPFRIRSLFDQAALEFKQTRCALVDGQGANRIVQRIRSISETN